MDGTDGPKEPCTAVMRAECSLLRIPECLKDATCSKDSCREVQVARSPVPQEGFSVFSQALEMEHRAWEMTRQETCSSEVRCDLM